MSSQQRHMMPNLMLGGLGISMKILYLTQTLIRKTVLLIMLGTAFLLMHGCAMPSSTQSKADATALAEQNGLHLVCTLRSWDITLPLDFDADLPNWGLKQAASVKGGYDMRQFAGKQVRVTGYRLKENYRGNATALWMVEKSGQIIGAYVTVDNLMPGIFGLAEARLWN